MQRLLAGAAVVAAPGGLAVEGDMGRRIRPEFARPAHEAGGEQFGIDAVHQGAQPVGAGHAPVKGQEAAQEWKMRLAQSTISS